LGTRARALERRAPAQFGHALFDQCKLDIFELYFEFSKCKSCSLANRAQLSQTVIYVLLHSFAGRKLQSFYFSRLGQPSALSFDSTFEAFALRISNAIN
jgi:hypothetical protein